jgi:hypothetical protein
VPNSLIFFDILEGSEFRANFKYKHPGSNEFLGLARRRSLLLIAVRPRNLAIR